MVLAPPYARLGAPGDALFELKLVDADVVIVVVVAFETLPGVAVSVTIETLE